MGKLHEALRKAEAARATRGGDATPPAPAAQPRPRAPAASPARTEPAAAQAGPESVAGAERIVAANFAGAVFRGEADPHLVPLVDPHSPLAEQYRTLRTNLIAQAATAPLKVLAVTSSVPGEGKSVTAANLACVLAEDPEKKVILIDGDMRKPTAHSLLGVDNHRGLSDYLAGGTMLEMALQRSRLPNLWVLPAGHVPTNPTELLSGKRMEDLLARLRRDYHWIVIDTPPVIATTDAGVLSSRVDGTVLVLRMEKTQKEVAKHAIELLRKSRANVVGSVLTGLQGDVQDYYYYPANGRTPAK